MLWVRLSTIHPFADVDLNSLDKLPIDIDDVFVLPYSSGTTGSHFAVFLSVDRFSFFTELTILTRFAKGCHANTFEHYQ